MILIKKLIFFHFLNLGKISQINVFDDILDSKKSLFRLSKHRLKKVKKLHFSKGVIPWFSSKI